MELLLPKGEASSSTMPAPRLPLCCWPGCCSSGLRWQKKVKQQRKTNKKPQGFYTRVRGKPTPTRSCARSSGHCRAGGSLSDSAARRGAARIAPPAGSSRRGARWVRPRRRRRWGGASWWFGFIFLPKFAHKWSKGQMCVSASCWLILWDFFPLAPSPFTPQTISGSPIFKDRVLQLLLFFPSILTYCSVCENGNIMLVWFPWEHVQWPEVFLPSEFTALKLCCCPLNIHKVLFFNSEYMATWDCSDIWPFQTEILLVTLMGSSAEHGAVGWMGLSQRSAGTACSVSALCTLGHLLQETSPGWYFCWRKEFCFHVPCQSLSLNSQRQVSKKLI